MPIVAVTTLPALYGLTWAYSLKQRAAAQTDGGTLGASGIGSASADPSAPPPPLLFLFTLLLSALCSRLWSSLITTKHSEINGNQRQPHLDRKALEVLAPMALHPSMFQPHICGHFRRLA